MNFSITNEEYEKFAEILSQHLIPILKKELNNETQEPFITQKEACEFLGFSPKSTTIYNLVAKGEIPHYRILGSLRFKQSELLKWVGEYKQDFSNPINETETDIKSFVKEFIKKGGAK